MFKLMAHTVPNGPLGGFTTGLDDSQTMWLFSPEKLWLDLNTISCRTDDSFVFNHHK